MHLHVIDRMCPFSYHKFHIFSKTIQNYNQELSISFMGNCTRILPKTYFCILLRKQYKYRLMFIEFSQSSFKKELHTNTLKYTKTTLRRPISISIDHMTVKLHNFGLGYLFSGGVTLRFQWKSYEKLEFGQFGIKRAVYR